MCYQSILFPYQRLDAICAFCRVFGIVKILPGIVKKLRPPFMELALRSDLTFVNTTLKSEGVNLDPNLSHQCARPRQKAAKNAVQRLKTV